MPVIIQKQITIDAYKLDDGTPICAKEQPEAKSCQFLIIHSSSQRESFHCNAINEDLEEGYGFIKPNHLCPLWRDILNNETTKG